ncbi:hypothetical protein [Falsibacillus albus]|uniref:hypothetical protein n=1 Tax=Falsibacillus albus TaxID=2478915 RepID=UPI001314BAFE|nr:hypothetical protein [Falsibacillus albus]
MQDVRSFDVGTGQGKLRGVPNLIEKQPYISLLHWWSLFPPEYRSFRANQLLY